MSGGRTYRGRLAPSPTGHLHLGHARTFWTAQERAQGQGGVLVLRNEDLDRQRCKPEFVSAMLEDLRWFGFHWVEGPDVGGPHAPYTQSERMPLYRTAFERLRAGGFLYPCTCSRQDVLRALQAPHQGEDEPVYPGTCRGREKSFKLGVSGLEFDASNPQPQTPNSKPSWRFRVSDGQAVSFHDGQLGPQTFVAGADFGDFVVWRNDDLPAYQLACVVDDAAMGITEVVRGADLLASTARQLLLYEALGLKAPAFHHCPLMTDERGVRLAKRHDALSLRVLRVRGVSPAELRAGWIRGELSSNLGTPMP
ncbi:MAG: tRNA glutamyl-Q(34) synthetase GluQRS [Proteobacteria bacterium]|nr:tRNA glutamyl-Q(34) synthetase GluQRS [Pseudomonadota bacterium]